MNDFLVIGSGLYGATVAQQLKASGKSVLVLERRPSIAGNVYIQKTSMVFSFTSTEHISFIRVTALFGIMCSALQLSIASRILQ